MTTPLEAVAAGFAPVKSTRHLAHDAVRFDADGPVGDRGFCLVDVARQQVLRTAANPSLVAVVARLADGVLEVTLPTGESVAAPAEPTGETLHCDYWGRSVPLRLTGGPHGALLSAYLGREVRLAAAPRGDVVYADPVTVLGTASVADLGARVGRPALEAARFRPSLVVATEEPYAEEGWLGRDVAVGGVVLRIGVPIPRCAVIDVDPITGVRGTRLLRELASYRPTNKAGEPCFGVFARVGRGGTVVVEDSR